ncbi:MAG TPA: hypothetical protein VGK59_18535 [Ohtaekwangia sp.]
MTASELWEKYKSDLKELQANCGHPEISDWMEEQWAPAHGTGVEVRVCKNCNITIDRRGMVEFYDPNEK